LLLHIVARGKIGRSPEAELVERYLGRIAWPDQGHRTARKRRPRAPIGPPPARSSSSTRRRDARLLAFARKLEGWRDGGAREAQFRLGGADGFDDAARAEADLLLSFGRATWPHLLARAMLAEQLFRAVSILANHPYHREG
jgi:23S rRNA (pseudouridine1915-N3)-methyltransferase